MTERLILRNFAGLNLTLDIGEITILIGPQASGKSVCARCLYWCREFFTALTYGYEVGLDKPGMDAHFLDDFKTYFPNLWQVKADFSVRYEVGNAFVEITQEKKRLRLLYPVAMQKANAKLRTWLQQFEERYPSIISRRTSRATAKMTAERDAALDAWQFEVWALMENLPFLQAFVIAGRSIFSALKGTLLSFLATNPVADPLLQDFLRHYEYARLNQPDSDDAQTKSLAALVESILKGRLVARQNDDYLVLADGRQVSLAHASSGQQEAFPLVLFLLSYLGNVRTSTPGQALYVEEPEAHLYPDSQWAVVRLMAAVFNLSLAASNSHLFITTHSPYLLSAFNNLIRARQLAERFKDQPVKLRALYRIIPKNQHLALAHFRVYALEGGAARSIISVEDGLIVAEKLDEVSERISQQFDKLLQLEAQDVADEKAR